MTNNLGYLGNPKLRKAYTQVAMSQYEIDEYIKCMEDPVYFAKTYMKIIVLGKGLQPFDLYPFQEEMIRTFVDERFVICKIPRQSGKSITTIAFLLHTILFNESRNVAILAHKASAANGLLGRLKLAYENLPAWLQSGIIEWNKTSIELENGSKIAAFATSADGLRSGSFDCIIGSSEITIRENGMIRKTTIGQLFEDANSSKYKTTKKDLHDVQREQIYKMVFSNNRESKEARRLLESTLRKPSYYTPVYVWFERSGKHMQINNKGACVGSSVTLSYGCKSTALPETAICGRPDDRRPARHNAKNVLGKSNLYAKSTFRISEKENDWYETYRRNKTKNIRGQFRQSYVERITTKNECSQDRKIYWSNTLGRDKGKDETISTWEKEITGTYRQNQSQSRKNTQDGRKTPRHEKIGRGSTKNERSEERLYSLEQRFEVLTEGGFKKFCGVRKIERNETLLEISLVTGERITCTHDHLIMTKQGWKKAIEIKEHEVKTKIGYSFVNQIKEVAPEPVYDLLEVEDVHSFYANDILVHNCILLDEFAFVPSNIADAFFESTYPVITAGDNTKIIIVSTPKGMNTFYTMWVKATTGKSDYVPIEYHWYDVPWRDEKWKEQTIRNTSQQQWDQEFSCEFLGSSNTLISGAKLQQLMATMEEPIARIEKLRIFEHAKPEHTYVLTADVSEGLGLDYSTFSIIDVTAIPYRVVATFRDNQIKPILFPTILVSTAKRYNDAFILVEINSIGLQVADMIHYDLAYENLIKIQSKGKQGQQWTPGFAKKLAFGVKTSTQTKQIGCTNLKSLIESDKLLVTDEMTIKELTNFTANKKTYKAEEGNNDDLVMTLVNFSWLMAQKFFRETVSNDMRKVLQEEQLNIIDNDIVPFGAIDNGVDDPFNDNRDVNGDLWVEDRSRKYVFDNFDWSYGQASKF